MKHHFVIFFGVLFLSLSDQSNSASLRNSTQITKEIFFSKIHPPPKLGIGHLGEQDKKPLHRTEINLNETLVSNLSNFSETFLLNLLNPDSKLKGTKDHDISTLRREARVIIGALDRQSCFAKVVCRLGSKEPTADTNLLNDYAYLVGQLVVDSQENTGKPSTSLLGEILSTTGNENENDDEESGEEDDADSRADKEFDWYDIDNYRVKTDQVPEVKRKGQGATETEYIKIKPFPSKSVQLQRRRPILTVYRRLAKQLAQPANSRQCRQLQQNQNKCPYSEDQVGNIVTRLKGIMMGDGNDVLSTITMAALGTPNSHTKAETIQTPSSANSPGRVNLVVNLQQNLTMPQPQQSAGFAAFPFPLSPVRRNHQGNDISSNSAENSTRQNETNQSSPANSPLYYFVPLQQPVNNEGNNRKSTEGTTTTTTERPDPLGNLMNFLYSVGYTKNETEKENATSTLVLVSSIAPAGTSTDEDDSEEEDRRRMESMKRKTKKHTAYSSAYKKERGALHDKSEESEEERYIRIKSSDRTGRYYHHSSDEQQFIVRPQFITPEPLLLRAVRFLTSLLRGGAISSRRSW